MAKRKIIKIDENRCNGCGLCIPNCPEGALQIIGGKARLVSDLFCDGLGACIGHCPQGAISVEERESGKYDEKKVMENIVVQGINVIKAHLRHLRDHGEEEFLKQAMEYLKQKNIDISSEDMSQNTFLHGHVHGAGGCPGSRVLDFGKEKDSRIEKSSGSRSISQLRQWPVQIMLVPESAPYFENADLLIAADCVPFAYADFHQDLLRMKILLVGCPKLDDAERYKNKLKGIFKNNNVRSVTCAHMEVPCCFGMMHIITSAIAESKKDIPYSEITIGVKGQKLDSARNG